MKFIIKHIRNGCCRSGTLSDVNLKSGLAIKTPACMLYTREASVPHLTHDVLHRVEGLPNIIQVSANFLASNQEAIAAFQQGVAKFSSMQEFITYSCVHDVAQEVQQGFNDKSTCSVWGRAGRMKLDPAEYIKLQEAAQPDFYQCLSDADTDKSSARKRCIKSVNRTLDFLEQIAEKHSTSKTLKNASLLASLVGGYNAKERERCAKETSAYDVAGYVIEGFHNLGPKSQNFNYKEIKELLDCSLKHLPEDKPRVMHSVWSPDKVIEGVELGVDLFDSSYPYLVTERGNALIFNYKYETELKKDSTHNTDTTGFEISLKDKEYFDDLSPLLDGCTCYSCKTFTRSYINHLVNTSELLASVILMMHNLHHYLQFFEYLRRSLDDDKFTVFKKLILSYNEPTQDVHR